MTSQTGEKTVTIYVLPDISWGKDNKKIKFGQLEKYCSWKSCTECCGETSPTPFFKKIKIKHVSESTVWNFIRFV